MKAVIIPGNGGSCYPALLTGNFYQALATQLTDSGLFQGGVVASAMPDPNKARREIWIPHVTDTIGVDKDTVVIGHSSGAECGMRLCETTKVRGLVIVAGCHTDLGDGGERAAGWYPPSGGDWDWDAIKKNTDWIVQFHSTDDPFIPIAEARHVAKCLEGRVDYVEMEGRSHFFEPFDECFEKIKEKLTT